MKFHVGDDGVPRPCEAEAGKCPVGGEHHPDEPTARKAYEKRLEGRTTPPAMKRTAKPVGMIEKGYANYEVPLSQIVPYRDILKEKVGTEKASLLFQKLSERPTGDSYHVTLLSPKEFRSVKKAQGFEKLNDELERFNNSGDNVTVFHGVGSVRNDETETFYVVCENSAADRFRENLGLPKKDFHVTLGFTVKDIHDQRKDVETLL